MDYKTLLVHYDSGRTSPARLEVALEVACKFDAHVACLYALTLVRMPSYAAEAGDILMEAQRKVRAEMLESAKKSFDQTVRRLGADNVEWRASAHDAVDEVTLHGRYADLIVIGQKNEEWASGVDKAFEQQVLLAAGRPVLMVPYAFEKRPVGNTVLIAWSATREAARAASDALPILQRARQVHVVAFNPRRGGGAHGEVPGADIGLFLARHGVKVTVSQQEVPDVDVGNQLLSRAFDLSADLIVMGAYGHSRLQELILGGVTRTLLESMTVPVLMSH